MARSEAAATRPTIPLRLHLDVAALPDDTTRDPAEMDAHPRRITCGREGCHELVVALCYAKHPIAVDSCGGTLLVEQRLHTHRADVGSIKPFHIARRQRRSL